jgi:hypothetical protein
MSNTICGALTYSMTNSDSTAIDTSVFTFTLGSSGAANILVISTTNIAKVGSYSLVLSG